MKLIVLRYSDNGKSTSGLLFIDGKFECYTLEDEYREKKVMAETRIPEGEYEIKLRTEGGHHAKYSERFPKEHIGMLHVINVPNFEYILIHIGNTEKDTAGCLLVGNTADVSNVLASSGAAYITMYKKVAKELKEGKKVTIKYIDIKEWMPKF
jgi:hypothetical protein